jgi:hypothetical protein
MDDLGLSEMAYLNVPDKDRDKSPSPADSVTSSTTDISSLPMNLGRRREESGVSCNALPLLRQHYIIFL